MKSKNILISAVVLIAFLIGGGFYYQDNIKSAIAERNFSKANYYFNGGDYNLKKARQFYEKAIIWNSQLPFLNYQLARLDFIENNFKSALKHINKELEIQPYFSRSYYVRGLINVYAGNYQLAIEDFKKFLENNSQSWAGLTDLSFAYLKAGDYYGAEQAARKGLNYYPNNPWLNMNLGTALLNLGDFSEAKNAYRESLNGFSQLSKEDFQRAYPGNNPQDIAIGLESVIKAVEFNIDLAQREQSDSSYSFAPFSPFVSNLNNNNGLGFAIAACGESVGISVSSEIIDRGQSAILTWITSEVQNCSINQGIGNVGVSGSKTVSPSNTTVYTLSCISDEGFIDGGYIDGDGKVISVFDFFATGDNVEIAIGASAWTDSATLRVRWVDLHGPDSLNMPNNNLFLSWNSGEVSTCTASANPAVPGWSGSVPISSPGYEVGRLARGVSNPGQGKTYNFSISCNPIDNHTVTVWQFPVCSFISDPSVINVPESSNLNWSCQYANSCFITNDANNDIINLDIVNDANYRSSGTEEVRPSENTTFTLTCSGLDGSRDWATSVSIEGDPIKWKEIIPR